MRPWRDEAAWKIGEVIWRVIAVWRRYPKASWEEVKKIVQEELMKESQKKERIETFRRAFPSGYTKIVGAYTRYQNAKRFRTRMRHAKRLLLEVEVADKTGIFRDFESFRRGFADDLKQMVVQQAYKRVERREDREGTIRLDLEAIPEEREWLGVDLQEKYRQALEEARRRRKQERK